MSFAAIQQAQREQDMLPMKDKRSLKQIQEEEQAKQVEEDFLKWWALEEERMRLEQAGISAAASGASSDQRPRMDRGKGKGKGRGGKKTEQRDDGGGVVAPAQRGGGSQQNQGGRGGGGGQRRKGRPQTGAARGDKEKEKDTPRVSVKQGV